MGSNGQASSWRFFISHSNQLGTVLHVVRLILATLPNKLIIFIVPKSIYPNPIFKFLPQYLEFQIWSIIFKFLPTKTLNFYLVSTSQILLKISLSTLNMKESNIVNPTERFSHFLPDYLVNLCESCIEFHNCNNSSRQFAISVSFENF